ncbi:MAG: hypothetical protein MUC97_01865 [Bernardetiaceae bacterium]|jgi:hypothetical protein|nr:hypothetical protein [Bernardetiaceae bacterium]
MTPKIKLLVGVIAAQVGLIAWLSLSGPGAPSAGSPSEALAFALADTAGVDQIGLGPNTLTKQGRGWLINGRHPADGRLVAQLLEILVKVEVKKPAPARLRDSLAKALAGPAHQLTILANGQPKQRYQFGGQGLESYGLAPSGPFANQPMVLFLPGQNLVLYQALQMPAAEWRDKVVLASNFNSLRRLELRYPAQPADDFVITPHQGFYQIEGITQLDSAMTYNYVNAYRRVEVVTYVERPGLADSLKQAAPFATIHWQDINEQRDTQLNIYANPQTPQRLYGVLARTGEVVGLDPRYFTKFLVRKKDFGK